MTFKPLDLAKIKHRQNTAITILGVLIMLGAITAFFYYTGLLERIGS
jgi:hypothetical protein